MARPRLNCRRKPTWAADTAVVRSDDHIPPKFISQVVDLFEHDNGSDVAPRPSIKRQKQAQQACRSICIAKRPLTFRRRVPDLDPRSSPCQLAHVKDSHRFLRLQHSSTCERAPAPDRRVIIAFREGSPAAGYGLDLDLDIDLDSDVCAILRLADSNVAASSAQGALWVAHDLSIEHDGSDVVLRLDLSLFWNETSSPWTEPIQGNAQVLSRRVLNAFFPRTPEPRSTRSSVGTWSPMDFYSAAHVPSKDDPDAASIQVDGVTASFYPYQKRTLKWLLNREGVTWTPDKGVVALDTASTFAADAFRPVRDADGQVFYLNDTCHVVTTDMTPFANAEKLATRGGILAEEMGLGKTLEVIGLITLHGRPESSRGTTLAPGLSCPSPATLIVMPGSLRKQWQSELALHAPHLRVLLYNGCMSTATEDEEQKAVAELCDHDVVLTTYTTLRSELHYVLEPPARNMRYERKYRRAKSPLVQVEWWRVCLDEAQMIEGTVSSTAEVANALPRINAWAVTGTPIKGEISDLRGLLNFLNMHPYGSSEVWNGLFSGNKSLLDKLFNRLALRHTKGMVRDEINVPRQSRYVINVPFTAIEEQHYQSLFQQMVEDCDFDARGRPTQDGWRLGDYATTMSSWLNRLRQAALHPEVGSQNRQALGQSKTGGLRTVTDVLDAMIEQNGVVLRSEQRSRLSTLLDLGQLFENSPRVQESLTIWLDVEREAEATVNEARTQYETALVAVQAEAANGQGGRAQSLDTQSDDEDDEFVNKGKLGEYRRRLRASLEIQHRAVFFCANAYFQIREQHGGVEPDSDEYQRLKKLEDGAYERAKHIRRELLQESNRKAAKLIEKVRKRAVAQDFVEIPELVTTEWSGMESGKIAKRLSDLYGALNEQADLLDEWREKLIQIITRPLVDQEDELEVKGDEFEDSTKAQDELMAIVQATRAVISDRQGALFGNKNALVEHEVSTARANAKNGVGPTPEQTLALLTIRDEAKPDSSFGSMRGALAEARTLMTNLNRATAKHDEKPTGKSKQAQRAQRTAVESDIVSRLLKDTQAQMARQSQAASKLETEIDLFTSVMNARLEFYRQLQTVSDSVAPFDTEGGDPVVLESSLRGAVDVLAGKISTAESKQRYLTHLWETGAASNEPRLCIICESEFTLGVLTVCGHQFCKECMTLWWKAKRNCPVCKRALKTSNIHDITLKPQELRLHEDTDVGSSSKQAGPTTTFTAAPGIYTNFSAKKLTEIQCIDLDVSFTTKVDAIVRHLLWLRDSDAGAKSIIFSQYQDFLDVLQEAFTHHRITFASISQPNGISRFKEDPSIECFLLHARAHSSGLNLVNASHVFLCEPILNTAIELQAIARVDRIGQQDETTVWLYLVNGTVEESIYNLSVQRRMRHVGHENENENDGADGEDGPEEGDTTEANLDAANSFELEHAKLSSLMSKNRAYGETVPVNDLWKCLFGNRQGGDGEASVLQDEALMGLLAGEAGEAGEAGQ